MLPLRCSNGTDFAHGPQFSDNAATRKDRREIGHWQRAGQTGRSLLAYQPFRTDQEFTAPRPSGVCAT